jgi:hypothetical protein
LPASREELRTFGALLPGQLGCGPFKPSRLAVAMEMLLAGLAYFFISHVQYSSPVNGTCFSNQRKLMLGDVVGNRGIPVGEEGLRLMLEVGDE